MNTRPNQEATRTVGDGETAKQLRAAATKNYRYGLPGGVSSLMLDAAERLTAKPDPEAVTRMVEALRQCARLARMEPETNLLANAIIETVTNALLTKATRP